MSHRSVRRADADPAVRRETGKAGIVKHSTLRRVASAVKDPWLRMLAQVNEASTILAAKRAGRTHVEPLERRSLLSAVASSTLEQSWGAAAALQAAGGTPSVTSTNPGDGATGVVRDAFVSANIYVPSGGINADTLNSDTVRLFRASDGTRINASLNTSAGGDILALNPTSLLDAETDYIFEVTSGLKDVSGDSFSSFLIHFRTGSVISAGESPLKFEKHEQNVPIAPYTGVVKGPDGRLYAGTETGEIFRFDIGADGSLGNAQSIRSIIDANGGPRLVTGLAFDPASTASDLALWVTHSYSAIDNGPDWTGKVTRLSGPDLATVQDYVVGLPRSTRDHVTNQLVFGPDGAIYFAQPSNNAMGAPDYAWHYRPERELSAAILRLDTGLVRDRLVAGKGPLNAKTEDGGNYDPAGAGAPLTIFAHGVRNAYDLLWHSNGQMYAPVNGSQMGGNTPAGGGAPAIDFINQVENDLLYRIDVGGYYGHPNPTRGQYVLDGGNPTDAVDPYEILQYPVGTQPTTNWRLPVYDFGQHYSPNGIIEYRGGAFGGVLDGRILVARYSGGDDIAVLTVGPDGSIVDAHSGIEGLKNFSDPLDITEDLATGFLYIVESGGKRITLAKPAVAGSAPGDPAPVEPVPQAPYGLVVRPGGRGKLQMSWTDTVGENGYLIERAAGGSSDWMQIATTGANNTSFVDIGLERGRSYIYRVRAANDAGVSNSSPAVSATVSSVNLPSNWSGRDIGSVGRSGFADYSDGEYEVSGSGGEIGAGGDAFFFGSVIASGDIELVARVASLDASHPMAKAGVMIRAGDSSDSPNAFMALTATRGPQFQARSTRAGDTMQTNQGVDGASWYWLRLVRRGDLISGYTSLDGSSWTRVSFARVSLGGSFLAGLAVSSHDDAALAAVKFDHVRIVSAAPLAVPERPGEVFASANGSTTANISWRDNSMEEAGFVIDRRRAGSDAPWVGIAEVNSQVTEYVDDHLAPSRRYEYRVRAINLAGSSAASNISTIKTGRSPIRGQIPFSGVLPDLPGLIEAEAFDDGPKAKAWKDRTPDNDLGALRDTGVDIQRTNDPQGGNFDVAAARGEWLEYTVNVPVAGIYAMNLRFAADNGFGGTVRLEVDGHKAIDGGSISLAATGGWNVWHTASGIVSLRAGVQVFRLMADSDHHPEQDAVANINWMRFTFVQPAAVQQSRSPGNAALRVRSRIARVYESVFNPAG